jgi:hypothetical protein
MSSNTPPRSVLRSWRRHSLLRPRLTSRSGSTPSPFQAQSEISPGKNALLHRTAAGSTPLPPWSRELRGCLPARPGRQRLISGSCSSARGFDPRFLPTLGRPRAVALHFAHCDQFTAGLAPARVRPCWAHKQKRALVQGALRLDDLTPSSSPKRRKALSGSVSGADACNDPG